VGPKAERRAVVFDRHIVGAGEPRDGLVAIGVVNEDGSVGLDEDHDVAALDAVAGAFEANGTVTGEYPGLWGHTPSDRLFSSKCTCEIL